MTSSMTADSCVDHDSCRLSSDFATLRQSALFAGVHPDVVRLFAYLSARRTFQPDSYLIEQGKKATQSFLLTDGTVDITVHHHAKEIVLQQLECGEIIGELALLAQFDWFFSARAADIVEVVVIDQTAFKKVIEQFPEQRDKLTERVIQLRIKRMESQTAYFLDRFLPGDLEPTPLMI